MSDSRFRASSTATDVTYIRESKFTHHRFTFHIRSYFAFVHEAVKSPAFPPGPVDKPKWMMELQPLDFNRQTRNVLVSVHLKRESAFRQPTYYPGQTTKSTYPTAWFSIQLLLPKTKEPAFLECNIEKRQKWEEGYYSQDAKKFEKHFSRDTFTDIPLDTQLTLICDFSILEGSFLSAPQFVEKIPDCRLLEDMAGLFMSAQFADVTVVCKGQQFPCHKAILAARSPVLAAMFRHDTKESAENRVLIKDVEPEVLAEMLRFIYTGKVNNLTKMASQLLHAADKYALERLKLMCEDELCRNLNMDTLKEALILADRHSAQYLRTQANQMMKSHNVTFSTESK